MGFTYTLLDVLNEERRGPEVVNSAVEEPQALLGVEVNGDDVVEASLDKHLSNQLERDVTASSHFRCSSRFTRVLRVMGGRGKGIKQTD